MSTIEKLIVYIKNQSATRLLLAGYCLVVLLGTLLLCLPVSLRNPSQLNVFTAFFTATSSACVTGLILVDTWTHWTIFGQMVILFLIQIGGLGFMTVCVSAVSFTHHKIGMSSRIVMQNALSAPQMGGIVRMTRFVTAGTLLAETIGAFLLAFHFIPQLGLAEGLWYSIFHSVSAFCNAGFDLMGQFDPFGSLISLSDNLLVNLTIMALIVSGGLGFLVWSDLLRCRFQFQRLSFHSKISLSITLLLLLAGVLLLFVLEKNGPAMSGMSEGEKWLTALFQAVTARTAGFNTLNLGTMTEAGLFVMILLMLVG
ncbi:MAG: Trk family potassium uptake protein, partial [Firmicutes bacterium]|nr:Trk family potassium uptake protein [Bacillota bacterium]